MATLLFLFGLACIGVGAVGIGNRLRVRRSIPAFRQFQQLLLSTQHYKNVDGETEPRFAVISAELTAELETVCSRLGDVILQQGEMIVALRVYLDESRTTLVVVQCDGSSVSIGTESFTEDVHLQSRSGRLRMPWTEPPFVVAETLPSTSVAELLAAHAAFVGRVARQPLRTFQTMADVREIWTAFRERELAWRATQNVDELLESDLRVMLGPGNEQAAARARRALGASLPEAVLKA